MSNLMVLLLSYRICWRYAFWAQDKKKIGNYAFIFSILGYCLLNESDQVWTLKLIISCLALPMRLGNLFLSRHEEMRPLEPADNKNNRK